METLELLEYTKTRMLKAKQEAEFWQNEFYEINERLKEEMKEQNDDF